MGRCFNAPNIAFKSKNSTTLQLSYSWKDPGAVLRNRHPSHVRRVRIMSTLDTIR
jgi:hypothetical protein